MRRNAFYGVLDPNGGHTVTRNGSLIMEALLVVQNEQQVVVSLSAGGRYTFTVEDDGRNRSVSISGNVWEEQS